MKAETYTGMYAMHKYFARKPFNVIRNYIQRYTKKGDIILDPFCGSGVTGIEAVSLGRKAILVDINPAATFITQMTAKPVDIRLLVGRFEEIKRKLSESVKALYETKCRRCGHSAIITHSIWKKLEKDAYHEEPIEIWYRCEQCGRNKLQKEKISDFDKKKLEIIGKMKIPYWYPKDELIFNQRINVHKGMTINELFTKRNLLVLAHLYSKIEETNNPLVRDMLRFVFSASLSQASKMVFIVKRNGKKSVGSWVAGYWIPNEHFEVNAWNCFENRFKKILFGKNETNQRLMHEYKEANCFKELQKEKTMLLLTGSATELEDIPDESVDYVFTDPPHGDNIPYLELSVMWCSWLRFFPEYEKEIIISDSPLRQKDISNYRNGLTQSLSEISRVLKAGKSMTITFNHSNPEIWRTFMSACFEAKFSVAHMEAIKNSSPSVIQSSKTNTLKADLAITFRKSPHKTFDSEVLSLHQVIWKVMAALKDLQYGFDIQWSGNKQINHNIYLKDDNIS